MSSLLSDFTFEPIKLEEMDICSHETLLNTSSDSILLLSESPQTSRRSNKRFRDSTSTQVKLEAPKTFSGPLGNRLLAQLKESTQDAKKSLEKLKKEIIKTELPISEIAHTALETEAQNIKRGIEWITQQLDLLMDTSILEPKDLDLWFRISREISILKEQLELYICEVSALFEGDLTPCLALVFLSQPFPCSVRQGRPLEDSLALQLLSGARFSANPKATVKAEVVQNASKEMKVGIEGGEGTLSSDRKVFFHSLKFLNGTRLRTIQLEFSANIKYVDGAGHSKHVKVTSKPSAEVIIKTNENQWWEAEGILLKNLLFSTAQIPSLPTPRTTRRTKTSSSHVNNNSCTNPLLSWQRMCNHIQWFFLYSTRQTATHPVRALSSPDFEYFHSLKFHSNSLISLELFSEFWLWFGPLMHKVRYQRHVSSLYKNGFFAGFLTRQETENVLLFESVGTFLLRVSEKHEHFVVSYRTHPTSPIPVKHYLIKNDDLHGSMKTLPDFLGSLTSLNSILQITMEGGERVLHRFPKETVLKTLYSHRDSPDLSGYEETIDVGAP